MDKTPWEWHMIWQNINIPNKQRNLLCNRLKAHKSDIKCVKPISAILQCSAHYGKVNCIEVLWVGVWWCVCFNRVCRLSSWFNQRVWLLIILFHIWVHTKSPCNTCSWAAENLLHSGFSGSVHVLDWCSLMNMSTYCISDKHTGTGIRIWLTYTQASRHTDICTCADEHTDADENQIRTIEQ